MPEFTLRGVPEDVMDRLRELAETERRSLSQQAVLLLKSALAAEPLSFRCAYRRFQARHGPSPLEPSDRNERRPTDPGRPVEL